MLHTLLMVRYMAGRRSLGDKAIMERNTKDEKGEPLHLQKHWRNHTVDQEA